MKNATSRLQATAALAALVLTALVPAGAQVTYDGFASWKEEDGVGFTYDASGSDKLVVVVTGEHHFPDNLSGELHGITYNGQTLIKAVEESPADPAGGGHGQTTADIWYLDDPGSYAGSGAIDVSFNGNSWVATAIGLSDTADGVGATAHVSGAASVDLATSAANSMVIALVGMGGQGNSASPLPGVAGDAPLTTVDGLEDGSNYAGHAVGHASISAPGPQTFSFDTGKTDVVTIAAEFLSPDLNVPSNAAPALGVTVPGGPVSLSWTNLPPNTGTDVWVDVWFGTDAGAMVQVADGALNISSVMVTAPLGDTYYWRVDSYLDGAPGGTPITGSLFYFVVEDGDNDGMPDSYEEQYTSPPDPLALTPDGDLEPDGLTNLEEYQLGTIPDDPDSDGDGLDDGPELAGVGMRPPTDPTNDDTDGDAVKDGAESNTGNWVSSSNTGTNPTVRDSEGDGLEDGVETGTGIFVDAGNTGTFPTLRDSDSDGAEDWYEVMASFTDPTYSGDKPNVPYPLPDPDDSPGVTTKPVKVYILSGQSNMVGYGRIDGSGVGTLETLSKTEGKFPNLVDDGTGDWALRSDVLYEGVIAAVGQGGLAPGFGADSNSIGPELGFGHVMGWFHNEPVLVIKASQGGRSLGWDFLPPGSTQYMVGDTTRAGFGDEDSSWSAADPYDPTDEFKGGVQFYGGKMFDDCFRDEADHDPSGGAPVFNVTDILDNFDSDYSEWAGQGFEIAGFVWWQGWNDGLSYTSAWANRYEENMVQFIKEIRDYYENRYPGKISPDAPFVLATAAFNGWDEAYLDRYPTRRAVLDAQLAVSGETGNYPEFAGNVKTMEARGYWRDEGPNTNQGYHYNQNAETFMLVGDALGRGMIELLGGTTGSGPVITSITVDGVTATMRFTGKANTAYTCKSSTNLPGFPTTETPTSGSLTTGDNGDGTGDAIFSVTISAGTGFYRVEE